MSKYVTIEVDLDPQEVEIPVGYIAEQMTDEDLIEILEGRGYHVSLQKNKKDDLLCMSSRSKSDNRRFLCELYELNMHTSPKEIIDIILKSIS